MIPKNNIYEENRTRGRNRVKTLIWNEKMTNIFCVLAAVLRGFGFYLNFFSELSTDFFHKSSYKWQIFRPKQQQKNRPAKLIIFLIRRWPSCVCTCCARTSITTIFGIIFINSVHTDTQRFCSLSLICLASLLTILVAGHLLSFAHHSTLITHSLSTATAVIGISWKIKSWVCVFACCLRYYYLKINLNSLFYGNLHLSFVFRNQKPNRILYWAEFTEAKGFFFENNQICGVNFQTKWMK